MNYCFATSGKQYIEILLEKKVEHILISYILVKELIK